MVQLLRPKGFGLRHDALKLRVLGGLRSGIELIQRSMPSRDILYLALNPKPLYAKP